MRNLITITAEEKEDMLIQTLKAQEMDLYIHNLNKERYQDMLPNLPEGPFKVRIEGEINTIDSRLVEVNAVITALDKQIPVGTDVAVVMARLKAKEEAVSNPGKV